MDVYLIDTALRDSRIRVSSLVCIPAFNVAVQSAFDTIHQSVIGGAPSSRDAETERCIE
jgi:hypothetical protein